MVTKHTRMPATSFPLQIYIYFGKRKKRDGRKTLQSELKRRVWGLQTPFLPTFTANFKLMTFMDTYDIHRFLSAQEEYGQYDKALKEIEDGRKRSHWIWYVFPQMRGLGHSRMARVYGISSLEEAKAYWANDILRERLVRISNALLSHKEIAAEDILGCIDAMKVQSCMTLFDLVSPHNVFEAVLDAFYKGKRCEGTLDVLRGIQ